MTIGSWSVGSSAIDSPLYAEKIWNGADGKFETWIGGTRVKWNTYTMTHTKWTQSGNSPGDGWAGGSRLHSAAGIKAFVGWTANDDLRVLNKLAEQIKGHSFDMAINMAESAKTYGLVLSNLRSLGGSLVDLKRGNIAGAFRRLGVPKRRQRPLKAKDVSGRWLEMQYGWRPLVDQAYEAGKALESLTKHRVLRFSASSSRTGPDWDFSTSPGFYHSWMKPTVRVKYLAELSEDITIARSLGLTNPLAVAWEIVPYSFVVDWFLPVGSYLSAWGVIPALKGRFLTITKATLKGHRFDPLGPQPPFRPQTGYGLKETHLALSRVSSTSLSVPRPTFKKVPQALSPAHIYNAVALVHQLLGK